jgi:hypothetical protein
VSRDQVARILVEQGGSSLVLAKREGAYWLESPVVDRASEEKVSTLLSSLTGLRVSAFVDAPPPAAEIGLDPAQALVEVVLADDGGTRRLELGAPVSREGADKLRYGRFSGQVVEIGDALDEHLARAPQAWQADRWSSFDVWQVDRAVVRQGGEETTLERAGGDWKRGDETIGYDAVSDLLYAIDDAAAEDLAPAAPSTWGEPVLEVELAGNEREEKLALYGRTPEGHPATSAERSFALLLSDATVDDLLAKLGAMRAAEPKAERPAESEE